MDTKLILLLLIAIEAVATQHCDCGRVGNFLTDEQQDNIREQLKIDEGYRNEIYRDSEGHLTFGIGHLIIKGDAEFGEPAGTNVSDQRINQAFNDDYRTAAESVLKIFPDAPKFPGEVKEILVNMLFNLGETRFKTFKKMIDAVERKDWDKAADEMIDSKWYKQVKDRAKRLVTRMRSVAKDGGRR